MAVLPRDLGPMGPSLKLGLDAVRNRDMAFCFRPPADEAGATAAAPRHRSAALLLYLESREGAVAVVGGTVGRAGSLPPQVTECCLEVLRGTEIRASFVVPGRRYAYLYEVEE